MLIRKFTCLALTLLLLYASASPAPAEDARTFDGKVLATMDIGASAAEINYFFTELLHIPIADFLVYPSINEALLALKMNKVDTVLSMDASADYIAAGDDSLVSYMDPRLLGMADIALSMMVLRAREDLGLALDAALSSLTGNGVLQKLTAAMYQGEPADLPVPILPEDEPPLRVGVTGDIPPIDYVDAAGRPAGFNVSLMHHLAAEMGRNVEFILLAKGAIVTALATEKIDIVFWQEQSLSDQVTSMVGLFSNGLYLTKPYLTLQVKALEKK